MDRDSEALNSVIVVEAAAGWPNWISEYQRIAPNSVVIVESSGGDAADFALRINHRVEEMMAGKQVLRVAALICNLELDEERLQARYRIGHTLLRALDRAGSDLVLAVSDSCEPSKHAILALAGDLCESVDCSNLSVRVRFAAERSSSGTMAVVQAVTDEADAFEFGS